MSLTIHPARQNIPAFTGKADLLRAGKTAIITATEGIKFLGPTIAGKPELTPHSKLAGDMIESFIRAGVATIQKRKGASEAVLDKTIFGNKFNVVTQLMDKVIFTPKKEASKTLKQLEVVAETVEKIDPKLKKELAKKLKAL